MSIRPILKMGDPRLIQPSAPVTEFGTPELNTLIADMFDTMAAANGAGLAAPQMGVLLRVVIFGFDDNERYPEAPSVPKTILINPTITPTSEEVMESWEGCLSLPGLRGVVRRWKNVHYEGFDQHGNHISRDAEGFHALVVQHECDHLDGILYPMRMHDLSRFGFEDALYASYS